MKKIPTHPNGKREPPNRVETQNYEKRNTTQPNTTNVNT